MTQSNIRRALEARLAALTPALATAYQNDQFAPVAGVPYQECFVIPVTSRTRGLGQKTALHSGIFQVNLCYPAASGTKALEARADALIAHFRPDSTVLEFEGVVVRFLGAGQKAAPVPGRPGLYVVPVSFRYTSIF